jgi:5-methylcytosine-specific restriction endonuclease McrA
MSWYNRRVAPGEVYRCERCGKVKRVKYVPKSKLCRTCASQTRRFSNPLSTVSNGIVVTKMVENKLKRGALIKTAMGNEALVNKLKIGESIETNIIGSCIIICIITLIVSIFHKEWTWITGVIIVSPFLLTYIIYLILERYYAKPRSELKNRIELKFQELAKERQTLIEEQRKFYSSPEWINIRARVIREEGDVCSECNKIIHKKEDVTVDHIRPRSRYPELALNRDNLHVLCRKCNSSKGSNDFLQ